MPSPPSAPDKYLLNPRTKVAHVLPTIERCNGDAIEPRIVVDELPEGYRMCRWCANK